MSQKKVFLVLPYLTTSKPVEIRGVCFRSSNDTEGFSLEVVSQLNTLFAMFFLHGDLRIREMVYAILEYDSSDDQSFAEVQRKYSESCLLIEYLYTNPHAYSGKMPVYVENATMYLFGESSVAASYHASNEFAENIDETKLVHGNGILPGFTGTVLRRHNSRFSVVDGSRIYPPDHFIQLNILHRDLSRSVAGISLEKAKWALADLLATRSRPLSAAERRAIYAMRWFSDSCRSIFFDDQSLLLLAIAFETLLNIDPGNKERATERLRVPIKAIVGGFPRIDSWVEQFYNARSRVVHEGGLPDSLYYAIDRDRPPNKAKEKEGIPHRSLTEYGRTIFHLCVDTLLSGSRMAEEAGLQESLIHNHERLGSICQALDRRGKTPDFSTAEAAKIALDLRRNWSGFDEFVDTKILLKTLRRSVQIYNDESPGQTWALPPEIELLVKAIFEGEGAKDELKCFSNVVALDRELEKLPWYDYGFGVKGDDPACLLLALVSYAATVAPVEARRMRAAPPVRTADRSESQLEDGDG